MSSYGVLLLLAFAGPFALSFDQRVAFYTWWPALAAGIAVNAIVFIAWDAWFCAQHTWWFNPAYVSSIRLFGLPLEEVLFFLAIPYASVFIYACVKAYMPPGGFNLYAKWVSNIFIGLNLTAIVMYVNNAYTLVNCSLALTLLIIQRLWMSRQMQVYFWIAYYIHLVFFIIINGVLTGMFTDEPIVFYNEAQITGLRFITIPIEDFMYALSCLLLPVMIIEYYRKEKVAV